LVRLARAVIATTTGMLFLLALGLLMRRLSGALAYPLDTAGLLAAAVVFAAIAGLLRVVWQGLPTDGSSAAVTWLVWATPAVALLMFAFSLSLPRSPQPALGLFWGILTAEEAVSLWFVWRRLAPETVTGMPCETATERDSNVDLLDGGALSHGLATEQPDQDIRFDPPHLPTPHVLPKNVSQQLTRAREEDGTDALFGVLRGHFAPRQRSLRLHVVFCPPFDVVPVVNVEKIEGPPVTFQTGQVLPYGARVDLRLKSASDEPQDVVLELHVRGKGPEG